nr:hypothetical protein B0A51_09227 [Rachicladosporium sp. CCFEE 5018]
MPLELHPMRESDIPAATRINFAAFGPDLMQILYPHGVTAADLDHSIKENTESFHRHKESTLFTKVIDTSLPNDEFQQIVGTALWRIYEKPRTEEELDAEAKEAMDHEPASGADTKCMEAFFGSILKARRTHMKGDPFALLNILTTHPDHHRRGIGAMQLKHGLETVDRLGLPAWLEGSPKGTPLYERFGWQGVGWLDFDEQAWGMKKALPHRLMLRPAKGIK